MKCNKSLTTKNVRNHHLSESKDLHQQYFKAAPSPQGTIYREDFPAYKGKKAVHKVAWYFKFAKIVVDSIVTKTNAS